METIQNDLTGDLAKTIAKARCKAASEFMAVFDRVTSAEVESLTKHIRLHQAIGAPGLPAQSFLAAAPDCLAKVELARRAVFGEKPAPVAPAPTVWASTNTASWVDPAKVRGTYTPLAVTVFDDPPQLAPARLPTGYGHGHNAPGHGRRAGHGR